MRVRGMLGFALLCAASACNERPTSLPAASASTLVAPGDATPAPNAQASAICRAYRREREALRARVSRTETARGAAPPQDSILAVLIHDACP